MNAKALVGVCALAAVSCCPAHAARDPFAAVALHPANAQPQASPAGKAGGAPTSATATDPPDRWNVNLRAVMVDGKRSLANVEGVLLSVGQVLDGHRLVAVREGEAEFIHNGHPVVLKLPPPGESRKP